MKQLRRYHGYPDAGALETEVVRRITQLADACVQERGAFHIVLAGGSTPRAIYRQLPCIESAWPAWHIYFGDERCLAEDDHGRNDRMAREAWLDQVPIPVEQIHAIPAQLGAAAGARLYAKILADIDCFDLVLLGLGEDGHTASLFPGLACAPGEKVHAVYDAPKPPRERISISAEMLGRSHHVWFIVTGEGKRDAMMRWQRGEDIPAGWIRPLAGVDIFTEIEMAR